MQQNRLCNNLNISEKCDRQWINGSWYKLITGEFFDKTIVTNHIETKCIRIGAVDYGGKIIAFDEFFCKLSGAYIVCSSQEGDGLNEYGTTRCPIDDRNVCMEIEISTGKETFYNSKYYKQPLVKRNVSVMLSEI